jgi:uncharacterized protein YlxW (UPF0749 family)
VHRPSIPLTGFRPAVLVTGLLFALAGVMFAAAATTSQGTDLRAERALELRDLVRQEAAEVTGLDDSVASQQRVVDDLAAGRVGDPEAVRARQAIDALKDEAGLADVTDRALSVTLDDAPLREPDDPLWQTLSPDDVIVHQADVQAVVNALWRGGATAMQVMDQRIINTSSVQCVGNTLLLQGRVYSPPYVITATGPVKKMRASLRRDPTVAAYRDWADAVGLGYELTRIPEITIPGFSGPTTMQYAQVPPLAGVDPAATASVAVARQ